MKKTKSLVTVSLILATKNIFGWTLVSSPAAKFPTTSVKVYIATSSCTYAGFTSSTMQTLVNDAIDDYWGKVPTSALSLSVAGTKSIDVSADTLTTAANKADNNTIVVGCSSSSSVFTSSSTLAVGGIACASGICKAAVLLNDTSSTQLASLSSSVIVTTFAHELGHALGLGHSSQQYALMYYSLSNKTQKTLSQDDIDGISYLYPSSKQLGGLGGACGTIDLDPKDKNKNSKNRNNFIFSLLFGLSILGIIKKLANRSNMI
jgi:hypothetical protein